MKVLHVISKFTESYAGMAIACRELAESQTNLGITATVITSNLDHPKGTIDKPINKLIIENKVRVIYCPVSIKSYIFSFNIIRTLIREMKETDVIHIHGFYRFPQSFAAFYAQRINKPYVISPHGSLNAEALNKKENKFFRKLYLKFIEKKNINNASFIHFTANAEKINAKFFVEPQKGLVIQNGIKAEDYETLPNKGFFNEKYGLSPNLFKILFLGRISKIKGLDILIESMNDLVKLVPNIILLVVGPDYEDYKNKLISLLKNYKIEDKVLFLGSLKRDMVSHAYVDSDLFILPSYSENFGLTIIESLACGCPVIISKYVNISNIIERNGLGEVIDTNHKEITQSVIKLYKLPHGKRMHQQKYVRDFTLKYFSWENVAESFKHAYKRLYN